MPEDRAADPFAATRAAFDLPEGVVYLDGNSLGPPPRAARERLAAAAETWGRLLIRGWTEAGWLELPRRLGARIAPLIGAEPEAVRVGDSTSVNLFKTLSAALALAPEGCVLSDSGNFPTDLHVASGLCEGLGRELRVVAPEAVADAIGPGVAVVMLTEVDYRTGRRHDMAAITAKARAAGALTLWDLAHSAGAFPVDLAGAGADFAVGCGYKYLNGGPGAPAFLYVAPARQGEAAPLLRGWFGHAAPFGFEAAWRPAEGADRMLTGTPPVLSMLALEAALELWEGVDLSAVRARAEALSERFVAEVEARAPTLALASPRDPAARGAQVSFRHPAGEAMMAALIARGVIGDFRPPDLMRFGFAPLYVSEADVVRAAEVLGEVAAELG